MRNVYCNHLGSGKKYSTKGLWKRAAIAGGYLLLILISAVIIVKKDSAHRREIHQIKVHINIPKKLLPGHARAFTASRKIIFSCWECHK